MKLTSYWAILQVIIVFLGLAAVPRQMLAEEVLTPDKIQEMEKHLVESRKAIRSGRVTLETYLAKFSQNPSQANVNKKYTIYFQDDKMRSDFEAGNHLSQIVFTSDTHIRGFSDAPIVNVFGPQKGPRDTRNLPDPRRLGMVAWYFDTISHHGYEEIFLNPNRDEFKVETGSDAGKPIWKVSFRISQKVVSEYVEYWLSRNQGGLPIYLSVRLGEGNSPPIRSIRTKLKKYEVNDVWFPSEVIFRSARGKDIISEEIITVNDAVFNEDVPKETFTIAGLGLPKGKLVDFGGKLAMWNGEQLVKDYLKVSTPIEKASPSHERFYLLALSILLALVAVAVWCLRAKKRTSS